ncbi:MAG: hypothetical protein GAK35_02641 [Herbaspirillum frisingense]|uniref:ParB/Spo0J HTH domain-containing protein n=1 Tax=Herbaspirillum frisingense TaxID=92645 RepID=A0A7V8FVR6_9BURK|nr:MAG: hypothetical protein GAK35_02641 [Herbaspirillum frisingense]
MSTKPSWRQLIAAGLVKRTDSGMWVRPSAIRIRDGFNVRDMSDPDFQAGIEELKAFKRGGGKVPALEVALSSDGKGVDVIEGHRRTIADTQLIAEGVDIEWVRIEPFEGSDIDQAMRPFTSQDNAKLKPMEIATGYKTRKSLFGLTNEELATRVNKSREWVRQMLLLADAPYSIQKLVRSGELPVSAAIATLSEHGEGAAKVIGDAKIAAAAAGKTKLTAAALRPWMPPARAVRPMMHAVGAVVDAIPEDVRKAFAAKDAKPAEGETITLPASVVYELLAQQGAIQALRDKSEKKAAGKGGKNVA